MNDANIQEGLSLESLVAEVVDDFRQRQQAGQRPKIEEYTTRYPQAAKALGQVLASVELIELAAAERANADTALHEPRASPGQRG